MKKILFGCLFLMGMAAFSQTPNPIDTSLSPNGVLDKIFDQYGNSYNLADIVVVDTNTQYLKATNPAPLTYGYFNLYLEDGCGLTTTDPDYLNRRTVIGRVFQDLSNFINSPLTNAGNTTKINIWVRKISNVNSNPVGILGLASSFYNMPYNTTAGFGGIADNEIWKTIHTGVDSYTNVVSPLVTSGISAGTSGVFYHGMMAFNFTDTTTPITWNTNLSSTTAFPNDYDLYSVVLHELTHALGFASLISATGTSKFGTGYNYYSRYDLFLKNNANTQSLLTNTGACNMMYNYGFNSALTSSILQPSSTPATYCANTIRFVGTSNVPVYTPSTFAPPSSLSHFEDLCVAPNVDNAYFVMSDAIAKNVRKRFLRPEERNTLGNLGYSVKTTFGVSTTFQGTATYTGTITGIPVAGINDGINTNGTFKFIGLATTASPIVINSSTDTTRRILSNDIGYAGFECLQDVFDSTARFNGTLTSVTSLTNPNLDVTYTTTVPGMHLLRYVPINGTLRGNITYVYVFVEASNFCGTPTACNLVINGDFESHTTPLPNGNLDNIAYACNWSKANVGGSADYFNSDYSSVSMKVPCNTLGYEPDNVVNKHGYGGTIIHGTSSSFYTEAIKTQLSTQLLPNKNYQLSFDVSLAEGGSVSVAKLQAYLSTTFTTYSGFGAIPVSNPSMLFTNPTHSTNSSGWDKIVFNFTTGASPLENTLYIGGITSQVNLTTVKAPSGIGGCNYRDDSLQGYAYYFIDNVKLIPIDGSFNLPANLCQDSQNLPDLNAYLNGLPTGGVFAGPGVSQNGPNLYSLNDLFDMNPGINTISYTYTNLSGCSVTIYSNINVIAPIMPTISGSSTAYPTAPNNTTVNTTTIPSGYTAVWSITGGTGTITTANNAATVGVAWTALPGYLTLTLTNTATGCTYSATQTIYSLKACDCLNTLVYSYTKINRQITITATNSDPTCTGVNSGGASRFYYNYGDGTSGISNVHTYAANGTYTVTISPRILGIYDQTICSSIAPYTLTVSVLCKSCLRQKLDNHITLYPNPVSSVLNLEVSFTEDSPLETIVRTVDGKELMRKQWDIKKGKYDLQLELPNNISDGMIFVELVSDEIKETRTVLIKK